MRYLSRALTFRALVHRKFSIIFNYTMLLEEYLGENALVTYHWLHAIKILCIREIHTIHYKINYVYQE